MASDSSPEEEAKQCFKSAHGFGLVSDKLKDIADCCYIFKALATPQVLTFGNEEIASGLFV